MKNSKLKFIKSISAFCILHFALCICAAAQEAPPAPSAPRPVQIPAVKEKKLANGLTVAVIERRNVPLVTVQLLVKSGAETEDREKAGLANMTAALLTKGTKTRTATQIAEEMEFLGGSINAGAGWNNSAVTVGALSNKIDAAMAIMADVVLNPAFKQEEIDLLKTQTLDNLTYNLKQSGFLANYVSTAYSLNEHPPGGTPESINSLVRNDFVDFHKESFAPQNSVLIFAGDITAAQANALAQKYFGKWKNQSETVAQIDPPKVMVPADTAPVERKPQPTLLKRILVVDLPNAGQAAVAFAKSIQENGRISWDDKLNRSVTNRIYYPAMVMNSLLGGGYSSRLNQEIRIKRGLSYGAGSSFAWRWYNTNFGTRTQTKNESAAEVAELVLAEIRKLTETAIADTELNPRKSVLTGNFGRNLETTGGLAGAVADLYSFDLSSAELNSYMKNVESVNDARIREFARENLMGGDLIIVGDYNVFKEDLAKRFPNTKVEVIKADELDLSRENLRKSGETVKADS